MSAKTTNYKRYPASDALKKGCPSTIESNVIKNTLAHAFVELREKYKALKTENQKSLVKLQQMDQLKKDNDSKLIQLTKKNDTINKLHTTIAQLNNDIKLLKETSVDRGDAQRLEGFIKKKDNEIEELKKQIDSTKINHIEHLKNTIHQLTEQIQYLKEGYGKFNVVDVSLKEENEGLKEELNIASLEYEKIKSENEALTQKLEKYREISTQLFDLG